MSPIGTLQATTSTAFQIPRDTAARGSGTALIEESPTTSEGTASPTASPTSAAEESSESGNKDDTSTAYTTRTSFNAATGEWTLVVERHPPEVGVTVAEQKGFLSQYSARVSSSTSVQAAVSMRI